MAKVFGYVRVSTLDQAKSGLSIDVQKDLIEKYAAYLQAKGYEWGGFFSDQAVSGKKPLWSRPSGMKLRAAVEPGDAVVFAKLDRGFRNTVDLLVTVNTWQQMGVAVHLLDCQIDTSTPAGKLMLTVLAAVAQFQRDRISELTKEGFERKKRKGQWRPTMYGFKWAGKKGDRRLVPDPKQRSLGRDVVRWRDQGWHWEAIYWHLFKLKVRWRNDQEVSKSQIQVIYARELALQAEEAIKLSPPAGPAGPALPPPAPGGPARPPATQGR